jgi:hypothetical protein
MRTSVKNLGWLALGVALAAPGAGSAQAAAGPGACDRPGACARGGRGGRHFDPKAVTTIQGRVVEVERLARGRHEGIHLTVAMGAETIAVRLGPAFYVDAQPVQLAKGDTVEVKGARTAVQGEQVILAQEVRRGSDVLALRDADGVPLWRGQGMGRR